MKAVRLSYLVCLFFILANYFSSLANTNKKTLFVDYFGLTIYNVDENADTVFEREDDLIIYALNHGFSTLILKSIDNITYGSGTLLFLKNDSISCGLDSIGSSRDRKYMRLASFLGKCRYMGIQHIAAADTPFRDSTNSASQPVYSNNLFFKNIIKFNEFYSVTSGYKALGYFDILYGESDYWASGNPTTNAFQNWRDFYLRGLRYMKSLKNDTRNTRIQYIATYIGDLTKVPVAPGGSSATPEVQADSIDRNIDWLYIEYYFNGKDIVKASPTATNAFFLVDRQKGARLYYFSRNNKPTIVIPLFGSSSGSAISQQNYFGDYLDYQSGYHYAADTSLWNGSIDSVTAKFEYYYTHVINPYNPAVIDPLYSILNKGLTMKELTEDSLSVDTISGDTTFITGNILYSDTLYGVGWFKYSTMPDANYFLKSNLDRDAYWLCNSPTFSLHYQDEVDEVINTGMQNCTASPCRNLAGISGLTFDVGITTISDTIFKWYKNGQVIMGQTSSSLLNYPALTPPDTTVPFLTTITVEAEITSYNPNMTISKGIFDHVRLRKEYSIFNFCESNTPVDHFEILELTEPACPDFDNGSVNIQYYSNWTTCSGHEYHYHNDSTNIDYIGDSTNNYTVSNLTAGSYTVQLWCDSLPTGDSITFSLFAINTLSAPTIYSLNNEFVNCYDSLSTDSVGPYATYTWIENGVDIPFYSSPSIKVVDGTYAVRVEDGSGCVSTSDPIVVNILPDSVQIIGPTIFCGDSIVYSVPLEIENNPTTYFWEMSSGSFSQNNNSITAYFDTLNALINVGVTATNVCGQSAENSILVDVNRSPSCPTVTASNTSCISAVELNWTTPSGCVAGYIIYVGTTHIPANYPTDFINGSDIGNVNSFTLPILAANTKYYFAVSAYDYFGNETLACNVDSFTCGSSISFTPTISTPYSQGFETATVPALPCGITKSDENFPLDGYSWRSSSASSCTGNISMLIPKNPNNTTAKNDWFFSNPLNLSAGEVYRIKLKYRIDPSQTESISAFISSSNDDATMHATSTLLTANLTYHSNCDSLFSEYYVAPTSGIYYVGVYANSSANKGNIYIDDLIVYKILSTHLTTASCGDSLKTCDTIHCETFSGATSYKFKFEDLANSIVKEYTVTTKDPKVYQFLGTDPLPMGHTYTVYVSATTGGGIWSPYGAGCDVYLKGVPTTGLTGSSCGGTLTDLNQLIYTNTTGICSINDFMYEFTDESTGAVIVTQRNTSTTSFLMTYITSPYVKYSTTYSVRVKLKVGNDWGSYGSACYVTTPAAPLTKLQTSYCNSTLSVFNSVVYCDAVLGVQDYRYHITGPSGYDKTFTRNVGSNNWNFNWTKLCCGAQNMLANTTYNVEVASISGGVWSSYGTSCTITTPATIPRMADTSSLSQIDEPIIASTFSDSLLLELNIFPNPNNSQDEFSIEIKGINKSNQKIKLSIYNLVGSNVYLSKTITKEENRFILKPQITLAPGIYLVEADVNGDKLRKRFVVD